MSRRKQFFLTLNGLNLHVARFKNTWKVTCFDEVDTFLNLNQEQKYNYICKYLEAEGFVEEGANIVVVSSPENDEDKNNWC